MTAALVAWSLLAAGPPAAAADEAGRVRAVVEKSVNTVLGVLRDKSVKGEERKKRVLAVVDPLFDLPLMAKLALGRVHWPKFSEPQRKEFIRLFVTTMRESYVDKIDLFTDESVEFEAPSPGEKGKYQMLTRVVSKGERYTILYKLYLSGGAWRIYDVEIEGVSLVRAYGSQYDQFLQTSNPDGLIAKLREKSLEAPKDLKAAGKKSASAKP